MRLRTPIMADSTNTSTSITDGLHTIPPLSTLRDPLLSGFSLFLTRALHLNNRVTVKALIMRAEHTRQQNAAAQHERGDKPQDSVIRRATLKLRMNGSPHDNPRFWPQIP